MRVKKTGRGRAESTKRVSLTRAARNARKISGKSGGGDEREGERDRNKGSILIKKSDAKGETTSKET